MGDNKKTVHVSIVRGFVDGFNERLRIVEVSTNQVVKLGQLYNVDPEKIREIIEGISEDENYKKELIQLPKESFNSKPPLSSIQYYSIAMIAMYALFAAQD